MGTPAPGNDCYVPGRRGVGCLVVGRTTDFPPLRRQWGLWDPERHRPSSTFHTTPPRVHGPFSTCHGTGAWRTLRGHIRRFEVFERFLSPEPAWPLEMDKVLRVLKRQGAKTREVTVAIGAPLKLAKLLEERMLLDESQQPTLALVTFQILTLMWASMRFDG